MKPICIIPIRSGSKGLPDKNMLYLDGKPMAFHTIQAALDSHLFDKEAIVVSTDSSLYSDLCREMGIRVVLRSEALASDQATTYDVLEDFLAPYADEQVFVLLQATSPLRTGQDIREAYQLFDPSNCHAVVSFSAVDKHPSLFTRLSADGMAQDIVGIDKGYRRQNQAPLYYPNGAIFMATKGGYLSEKSFFTEKTKAYLMPAQRSLDVDNLTDFKHAMGLMGFDYAKQDEKNKASFARQFEALAEAGGQSALIWGDDRLLGLELAGFTNQSLAGGRLANFLAHCDHLLTADVTTVLVSLGVNDVMVGADVSSIKKDFEGLFDKLAGRKVYVTTIAHSLFRSELSNADIAAINAWLRDFCQEKGLAIWDLNQLLARDGKLRYDLTDDGLHYNAQGKALLQAGLQDFLKTVKE
ncbi:cytidylyltransferase domain-containing protein [Streptococcus sp. DD12]|uniref:cytidylyltransferase domain-containing protein n=1 Tax=Streptococcus sp. DD12 TaxID=1777880 RepID=UPI0007984F94|nr:GDSL-type esterase/lipase family protein [Streptococcus sp. DD12]KXT76170.1 N-Acetylneuraminate cytidylyltransferase [Streptococcus sp. DD12]